MNAAGLLFGLASGVLIAPRPPRGGGLGDRARRRVRHPGRAARPRAEGGLALREVHRQHPRPLRRDLRLPRASPSTSPGGPGARWWWPPGLGGSLLVSYAQARGETVGVSGSGGLMQRAERLVLQILGCLFDPVLSRWLGTARGHRAVLGAGRDRGRRPRHRRPPDGLDRAPPARLTPAAARVAPAGARGQNLASPGQPRPRRRRTVSDLYPVKPHVAARSHLNSRGRVRAALPPVARQPRVVLGRAGQGDQLVPPVADRLRRRLRRGGLRLVLRRGASTPPSTASTGTSRRSATAPRSSGRRTRWGPTGTSRTAS